jgi:hypothetical protein
MFIVAKFTVAKTWNQPRCPSIDEWTKKMCCVLYNEICSAIKSNKVLSFAAMWMDIMLSKISQAQKDK